MPIRLAPAVPTLLVDYRDWMTRHRGLTTSTLDRYERVLRELVTDLGEEPSRYDAKQLGEFLLRYHRRRGGVSGQKAATAIRAFLRYLSAQGRCYPGLDAAIPRFIYRSLSTLPSYLRAEEVARVLAVCSSSTRVGLRDRAILLLLARLGLRAGDICTLRLQDIDGKAGTLRVTGKERREAHLPLTQELGDAIVAYLEMRPAVAYDRLFLTAIRPIKPFADSSSISGIVAYYIKRSGVVSAKRGAHVLRHSAATELLRQGASIDEIGAILRHRWRNTTAIYAKVNIALLKLVVQPWPEVTPC